VQYRPYKAEDFEALYALEEACFQPPFRFGRRYMREVVGRKDAATWIAEDDGKIAGFGIVHWENIRARAGRPTPQPAGKPAVHGEVMAYLETLEVRLDLRGRGAGGELLRQCEESARVAGAVAMELHVDTENGAGIGLYRAHGFERQGRVEGYYPEGRAAEVYVKRLAAD
jgi:ribosomal-protein-alanine N-acetyltransferase